MPAARSSKSPSIVAAGSFATAITVHMPSFRRAVFHLPAVIVNARTLEELGATSPRFFSDEVLFSHHPPMLTDFLNPALTFTYTRPPTLTTLRITWEESITPAGDLA